MTSITYPIYISYNVRRMTFCNQRECISSFSRLSDPSNHLKKKAYKEENFFTLYIETVIFFWRNERIVCRWNVLKYNNNHMLWYNNNVCALYFSYKIFCIFVTLFIFKPPKVHIFVSLFLATVSIKIIDYLCKNGFSCLWFI